MVDAVSRQERDAHPIQRTDRQGSRRRAVRRVHDDLFDVVKERVEPRPAEDPDHEAAFVPSDFFSAGLESDFSAGFDSAGFDSDFDSDEDFDSDFGRLSVL